MNDHLLDNDDAPVGRILSRREVLALFGLTGAALLAACQPLPLTPAATALPAEAATAEAIVADPTAQAAAAAEVATVEAANALAAPACVVRPELTEGPYFVDDQLNRSDIRVEPSDNSVKEGIPLALTFAVSQIANQACTPLAGAMVDVWHCDAAGVYSGVSDRSFDTTGQKWLRGYQLTGENGLAEFLTIYPGWYSGRAVHIHFKIRTAGSDGQSYEFTSQLFFDEVTNAEVYAKPPYASKGLANVPNASDGIYRSGGEQLLLTPTASGEGYAARLDIALDV
jgi:protocatechuate 3,4-dioxygenase beta subunit